MARSKRAVKLGQECAESQPLLIAGTAIPVKDWPSSRVSSYSDLSRHKILELLRCTTADVKLLDMRWENDTNAFSTFYWHGTRCASDSCGRTNNSPSVPYHLPAGCRALFLREVYDGHHFLAPLPVTQEEARARLRAWVAADKKVG